MPWTALPEWLASGIEGLSFKEHSHDLASLIWKPPVSLSEWAIKKSCTYTGEDV
jgi:hypothetical protein